jgi:microcystin-dependent protein
MAEPFVGEIRTFGGNYAPTGWALCNGQLLPIAQNTALFSLLGTNYGGDGIKTFGLPNLQGAAPLMAGQGQNLSLYNIGQHGGTSTVTLIQSEMPAHAHTVNGSSSAGSDTSPTNNKWGVASVSRGMKMYSLNPGSSPSMRADAFGSNGNDQPHNNLPPYLALTFIIALEGIYPARS